MIHVATLRRVRPGREAEFEERASKFFQRAREAKGVAGAYLLRPDDPGSGNYGILRSFEREADMQAFYSSPLFEQWESSLQPLVEGEAIRSDLHGLEAFFRRGLPPPRWKMAVLTWAGVSPAVLFFGFLVPQVTGPLPRLFLVPLINVFVVAALTWGIMPLLTNAFSPWLRKS